MPFTNQLTAVLVVPDTVALNCCDCAGCKVALSGEMETDIDGAAAVMETVALAERVGWAMLCAVTLTAPEGAVVGVV